jgi:flagellar motor switch protein FliN
MTPAETPPEETLAEEPAADSAQADPVGLTALNLDALRQELADHYDTTAGLGRAAGEVIPVGLESVVGQGARISAYTAGLTDYDTINAEFANIDHLGFELRVALSETEVMLGGLLVPLPSAGVLFGVDTSPEQMDDAAFAAAQSGPISERLREFLDLINLTLFTDGLTGTEITLAELRRGQVEWTMGMVQDVGQGAAPARVDIVITLESGAAAQATLVVPISLLRRFAEELSPAGTAAGAPAPNAAADAEFASSAAGAALFGAGAPAPDNVMPFPTAAGPFDAPAVASTATDADIPVHPVRFPPLVNSDVLGGPPRPIDILMDVSMRVSVELGRSSLMVEEILELGPGSVVELNKLAGEPVDVLVNDRLIARGEVVVVEENFGVRITEIVSPRQRVNAMGR